MYVCLKVYYKPTIKNISWNPANSMTSIVDVRTLIQDWLHINPITLNSNFIYLNIYNRQSSGDYPLSKTQENYWRKRLRHKKHEWWTEIIYSNLECHYWRSICTMLILILCYNRISSKWPRKKQIRPSSFVGKWLLNSVWL